EGTLKTEDTKSVLKSGQSDKLQIMQNHRKHGAKMAGGEKDVFSFSEDNPNAKKLKDNRRKMADKLRKSYEIKTEIKGGLKTDLRIEQTVESKLSATSKYKPADLARNMGQRALHFADEIADSGEENSTQNAWLDTADKGADGISRVYTISETAKYWRKTRNEKQIAKYVRKEEKLVKRGFKQEYKSALKEAKQTPLWRQSSAYEKHLQKKAIKRKYMKNAIAEYQKAKKAGNTGKVTYTTGLKLADKVKEAFSTAAAAVAAFAQSPAGKIAIIATLAVTGITALLGAAGPVVMMSLGGGQQEQTMMPGAGFPESVTQWQEFVTERMEAYGYPSFVNAILATIMQESGGNSESCGGDLMQCKACGNWENGTPPEWDSYTTEQKSIDAGCRYFITGMETWGVTTPDDYDGLQIVAQGYNYGYGFLTYMSEQGASQWTLELSSAFSTQKAAALGLSSYGHKEYGEEWLAKYMGGAAGSGEVVVSPGADGVVKTAQGQIGVTEDPPGSNHVLYNTEYYGSEVSGDAYPWCCVFVWWCFDKSGNGAAFYDGGKVAGCAAVYSWAQKSGRLIAASEAQYGDLALFGSNEHIEIVTANNGDGSYETVGGNTGSGDSGSQSNGGGVFARHRSTSGSFPITSFVRPAY
ncbi:MAG: lysozyme family protein, partial [Lachnospiraceae bacterium]|nr:lysozyme family protein [Lachnospiraceae bacterium]